MNSISLGGGPFEPLEPLTPQKAPIAASASAATHDTFAVEGPRAAAPTRPAAVAREAADPARQASPRPWPPAPGDLPRVTAWAALASRGPAEITGGLLHAGALSAGLLPTLSEQVGASPRRPRDPWDGQPTADGWRVPRNPSRTPVRPRCAFDVEEGTDDLGPLRLVSGFDGRLRALRLQWPEEYQSPAYEAHKAVFHDVLTRLPPDVAMHVVVEGQAGAHLRRLIDTWDVPSPERVHLHDLRLHSTPEQLYCPLTLWARDGAVLTTTDDGRPVLLLPRAFRGDTQVSSSLNRRVVQGTGAAPARLKSALPDLIVRRSTLTFEGGDMITNRDTVLIGIDSITACMASLRLTREAVTQRFEQALGKRVLIIEPQPDFHIDLGLTFLDDETVAVADPGTTLRRCGDDLAPLAAATRSRGLAERYDAVCANLQRHGFRTARVPNLAGVGLLTPYITYSNVLTETDPASGAKRVYMPTYDVPHLDETARSVYRDHGFDVIDMPSARLSTRLWGAIRCATGELGVSA